jgi:hypothetical protein
MGNPASASMLRKAQRLRQEQSVDFSLFSGKRHIARRSPLAMHKWCVSQRAMQSKIPYSDRQVRWRRPDLPFLAASIAMRAWLAMSTAILGSHSVVERDGLPRPGYNLPMRTEWQTWWRIGKVLLALAIVGGVGWRFATILGRPELWEKPVHARVEWLEGTVFFYILGLGFPAIFWNWLLVSLGERPRLLATVRAYYLGQLGKYIPGKAVGLLLRTGLLAESGIRPGVGAMTTTYETLTTMASGALVAAVLLSLLAVERERALWGAMIMLVVAGLPTLPFVFNRLMKLIARFAGRAAQRLGTTEETVPLPPVRFPILLGGLVFTAMGWAVLGVSLWAVLQALLPVPMSWDAARWGRCTAYVAVSWVVGFISFFTPGGLGVREGILQPLLALEIQGDVPPSEAEPRAVVIVLVLRLLWTFAEIMMACIVYWLPASAPPPAAKPANSDPGIAS